MHRSILPVFALLAAGCSNVLSLSPAVSDSSAIMDERLLGEWVGDSAASPMRVTVTRAQPRSYHLRVVEGNDSSTAIGRLRPIGRRWLLDLSPTGTSAKALDQHGGLPVHALLVLDISGGTIHASTINGDTLRARVRRGAGPALGLAVHPGGDVVLTDSTAVLEAGLPPYLSGPGILHEGARYQRPTAQAQPLPRTPGRLQSYHGARISVRGASPGDGTRKGMLYGAIIGAVGGAIVGTAISDPDAPGWFSGQGYAALGGGLAGALAGAIVGAIAGAVRQ